MKNFNLTKNALNKTSNVSASILLKILLSDMDSNEHDFIRNELSLFLREIVFGPGWSLFQNVYQMVIMEFLRFSILT